MFIDKEKSAVGMAVPATEKDITNNPKEIISDESVKIKVVFQCTGEISEIAEIENNIGAINRIVRGLSTVVTIPENGLKLIMNVNSDRRGMPTLKTLWGRIYGNLIVVAKEENRYISLTTEQIQSARAWLMKHTYEEEKQNAY